MSTFFWDTLYNMVINFSYKFSQHCIINTKFNYKKYNPKYFSYNYTNFIPSYIGFNSIVYKYEIIGILMFVIFSVNIRRKYYADISIDVFKHINS